MAATGTERVLLSIRVDLSALRDEISRIGTSALLVSSSNDGPPHIASVAVVFVEETLAMRVGKKTRANTREHPEVALVWPVAVDPDYCLLVDGRAIEEDGEMFLVQPTSAVFHRLATDS